MNKLFFTAFGFAIFAVLVPVLLSGCVQGGQPSAQAKLVANGSKVTIDYVGFFDNGTVFDTSIAEEARKAGLPLPPDLQPLVFTVGGGQVIKGFDKAVLGMSAGESKLVRIPPEEAYGPYLQQNVVTINASELDRGGGQPKLGMVVSTGAGARGKIISLTNATVTIDFNPPLAGKALNFNMTVKKIE